jgi:hypothetical protein
MASTPVAQFDSASAMVRSLARALQGDHYADLGMEQPLRPLIPLANHIPLLLRHQVYTWSGWGEALPEEALDGLSSETIARGMTDAYQLDRRVPAIAVGSSNGALVHLYAALGIPWLPQTSLIAVRRTGHPDDAIGDLEWGRRVGPRLLGAMPDVQLHQMHDPNQDRLMVRRMGYMRIKLLRLPDAYVSFIRRRLQPGGRLIITDCSKRWAVLRVAERHLFQTGAMGGLEAEEYLTGSPRVAEYLRLSGAAVRSWTFPTPDEEAPEAEWGFEPQIMEPLMSLAADLGAEVMRLQFDDPEDASPFVADLLRQHLEEADGASQRLLSESFILQAPTWVRRSRTTPWWALFGVERSVRRLERYLASREPFDDIGVMLFPHGVKSAGYAPIERWGPVLTTARRRGDFVGVDQAAYPADFAALSNYHSDLARAFPSAENGTPSPPLGIDAFDRLADEVAGRDTGIAGGVRREMLSSSGAGMDGRWEAGA